MDTERAIEAALEGRAVLFVGAGFSLGATNVNNEPFKTARQLAQFLASKVDLPAGTPLDDAAEEFGRLKGVDALISELRRQFTAKTIAQHHTELAQVPWRRIYTTNYDDVLEVAHTNVSRTLTPVTAATPVRSISKTDLAIHLNGYIDHLNRDTLWSQFKLTDASYASAPLDSPWITLFRQDLSNADTVFFVGYSIADLDIKRILFATPDIQRRTFFVLGSSSDTITQHRVSRFGHVLPLDTSYFAAQIDEKRRMYVPPTFERLIGNSVRQIHPSATAAPLSDAHVLDLFLKGKVECQHVSSSLRNTDMYFLERKSAPDVVNLASQKGTTTVVHSALGNGKSLLLTGVALRVAEGGRRVYEIFNRTDDLFRELDAVLHDSTDCLFVIDDYAEWLDVAEYLGMHASPNCSYLLAARTTTNDIRLDDLAEKLQRSRISEVSVDILREPDTTWVDKCFAHYGLWGEKTSWSPIRRRKYLNQKCGPDFSGVLVMLLNSPQIASRFESVLRVIRERREYHEVVITVLALSVLQYESSVNRLIDIWGERVIDKDFRTSSAVREICDVTRGSVILRSAITARFLLQKIADASIVVDTLEHIAKTCDKYAGVPFYDNLIKSLMRFGDLQLVLPETNRRTNVVRYYEGIKNLKAARNNPHFWLQYAIAAMVIDDYARAKMYFDTAYSLSLSRDSHDPYMIDNHYARYLLVMAVRDSSVADALESFRKARLILQNQITRERFHYPFRVASSYVDFYDTFEMRLSNEERNEIGRSAAFVYERAKSLPTDRRQQRYVKRCIEDMSGIMRRTGLEPDRATN